MRLTDGDDTRVCDDNNNNNNNIITVACISRRSRWRLSVRRRINGRRRERSWFTGKRKKNVAHVCYIVLFSDFDDERL